MNEPAPTSHPARVKRVQEVSEELFELELEVPPKLAESFITPGQFHELRVAGTEAKPFAIASAPGSSPFEYLVRRGFETADALATVGAPVEAGPLQGPGFPFVQARGRDLLLVATGTGVGPIRSVIHSVLRERSSYGTVTAVLGGRTPLDFGWRREWSRWEAGGVKVVSTVLTATPDWSGGQGHLAGHLPRTGLERTSVFVVGGDELIEAVFKELGSLGVDPSRLHLNV